LHAAAQNNGFDLSVNPFVSLFISSWTRRLIKTRVRGTSLPNAYSVHNFTPGLLSSWALNT